MPKTAENEVLKDEDRIAKIKQLVLEWTPTFAVKVLRFLMKFLVTVKKENYDYAVGVHALHSCVILCLICYADVALSRSKQNDAGQFGDCLWANSAVGRNSKSRSSC